MKSNLIQPKEMNNDHFIKKHGLKLTAFVIWLLLLVLFFVYVNLNDIPLRRIPALFGNLIENPAIYILLYAMRPLLFFPATIITLAGGVIFGPIGVLYVIIGSNLSALVAYLLGRYFGGGLIDEESEGIIQRYSKRLRENSFETVLIMRFILLPYDLVNILAGLLRIDWKAFILATMIGSIPGTIFFTLVGASFTDLDKALSGELPSLNPVVLGISIAMFVLSLGLSRYFRKREAKSENSAEIS